MTSERSIIESNIDSTERELKTFLERSRDKTKTVEQRKMWKNLHRESKERLRILQRLLRAEEKREVKRNS